MSKFTQTEVNNLLKGLPTQEKTKGLKHSACRVLDLLKGVPEDKFNQAILDEQTKLQKICKDSGLNVKGMWQRGVVGKSIGTLRKQGLEEYLMAANKNSNTATIPLTGNNQSVNTVKNNKQQSVVNNQAFTNDPIYKILYKGIDIQEMPNQKVKANLKAMLNWITMWKEATPEEKQQANVSDADIAKMDTIKPLVEKLMEYVTDEENMNLAENNSNNKWYSTVNKIWGMNSTNSTVPPTSNQPNQQQSNQQPKENIKTNNIGKKLEEIEGKLKGVIANLEKLAPASASASASASAAGGKRRKTRRGGKKSKRKMTRRNK
jgi:hypothetical protein